MANTIDSNLFLSSVQQNESRTTGKDILGKDDFLKLLMAQLQNQDPLNPMQDKEFISQMATFSSLEQMTNLNKSIDKLVQMETQSSLIDFSHFVGKEVTWHQVLEGEESEATILNGKGFVSSVQFTGDTVKFILEDGTELAPANIFQVNNPMGESPLIQASNMIGKHISWNNEGEEFEDVVESVSYKNGNISLLTENGQTVKINQVTKIY
ncbi:flagellar hook assembly protein FlgD [Bacillus niameyensis]|uniref:flagellar hook assembly protein FlgD n=1 Tax=Bacillus niameyensis TaxID=1522308 RepID=UPI00078301C5|nr:flagellar hook assembly protein FlgD [Bacillus niameyensis]